MMEEINKIAFLVHEPLMYAHYSSVWAEMKKDAFTIVLLDPLWSRCQKGAEVEKNFVTKIASHGYEYVSFTEQLRKGKKYKYVVSNHCMGGTSLSPVRGKAKLITNIKFAVKQTLNAIMKAFGQEEKYSKIKIDPVQYLPLQIGMKQVRFMYGADISDGWSLQDWNEIYDLFLCHGPNDEVQIKKKFHAKTALMGYPRYDAYFSKDLCVDDIVHEFEIDKSKKTILWMPTYDLFGDGVCSIPRFAKALSNLMADFNVIVRPHPISFRLDPEGIELLKSLSYKIDSLAIRDMNSLYGIADAVLCDHGGSAFGALYLGKKLIFLETQNSDVSVVGKNSSNQELMKYFPVVDVEGASRLDVILNNESLWYECMKNARPVFDKFFADYRGNSSEKAVEILGSLDTILNE